MLKLEQIQKNAAISGLEPGKVVRVVTTEQVGDNALTVYYKTAEGNLLERMLFRTDEVNLSLAEAGRPWAFDAPGADFKLAAEAYRINLAHPLMQSVTDIVLEQHRNKLKQGAVLVDPSDMGVNPKVMFVIDHSVKEGADPTQVVSRRMQFVEIDASGKTINAGWAPHLDLEPIAPSDMLLIEDVLAAPWIAKGLEQMALVHSSTHLVPEHFNEVRARREKAVDKTLAAVHERLVKEINFWSDRYIKLQDDIAAGKDVRLTLENVRRTIDELTARREARERELLAMRHVISATPVVLGGALVIPAGLLLQRKGEPGWLKTAGVPNTSSERRAVVAMPAGPM